MESSKTYRVFVPEEQLGKFSDREDVVFEETVIDEDTQEAFQAKITVTQTPKEGYERLVLQGRGAYVPGEWFVKILERQDDDDDEPITIFESKKLGDRRGYMLRSMISETEDKGKSKEQIMTTELQKKLEQRKKLVNELLKKKD